jgi:HPt (histidine-containing phosphotransfer) domain-containing protein
VDRLPTRLAELAGLAKAASEREGAEAAEARDALRRGLHNLAGSAPTLGLHELGRRAGELEARVIASAAAEPLRPDLADGLARDIERLVDTVA